VPRACVIVLDAVGAGDLPDAADFGTAGSSTIAHVAEAVGGLEVPAMQALGLGNIMPLRGCPPRRDAPSVWGRLRERSLGMDTTTGHWEMMGILTERPFPTYPDGFPDEVIEAFSEATGRPVIGNVAASGTEIIQRLGEEHQRTGAWIVYTSADSVFQIAAHEDVVPVPELYRCCEAAYDLAARGLGIGRVIARPFVGPPGNFQRTANRRDFALVPFAPTLLDRLKDRGLAVHAIGKIEDLFAGQGITTAVHTKSDDEGMDEVFKSLESVRGGLVFVNLVDFDTVYGHRNDPAGYAANLERFDRRLSDLLPRLRSGDLLIVTADHGNDPTTPSTDHSREHVPVFMYGSAVRVGADIGRRDTFADLGQTIAELFGVGPLDHGTSFLHQVIR
jgi:phosphopentomutase